MPYEPVPYWAKLPHPMSFKEATSTRLRWTQKIASTCSRNRGNWPVMIFDADGQVSARRWGEMDASSSTAAGIFIDDDDNLFMAEEKIDE